MTTYVLVHGGAHAAWCWETVVGPLPAAGDQVQAIDLPGRAGTAEDASTCTLADYVAAIGVAVAAPHQHRCWSATAWEVSRQASSPKTGPGISRRSSTSAPSCHSAVKARCPRCCKRAPPAHFWPRARSWSRRTKPSPSRPKTPRAGFYVRCDEADVQAALRRLNRCHTRQFGNPRVAAGDRRACRCLVLDARQRPFRVLFSTR